MAEEKFVTYKWLIGTSLSTLTIVVAILGIFYGMMRDSLNSKVNMELYASQYKNVCVDIDEIKTNQGTIMKSMNRFELNQILVMRALKIDPPKRD